MGGQWCCMCAATIFGVHQLCLQLVCDYKFFSKLVFFSDSTNQSTTTAAAAVTATPSPATTIQPCSVNKPDRAPQFTPLLAASVAVTAMLAMLVCALSCTLLYARFKHPHHRWLCCFCEGRRLGDERVSGWYNMYSCYLPHAWM